MRLLRRLADDGSTVLLTTHATRNALLCDKVIFLARGGHLAFVGSPRRALRYFGTLILPLEACWMSRSASACSRNRCCTRRFAAAVTALT